MSAGCCSCGRSPARDARRTSDRPLRAALDLLAQDAAIELAARTSMPLAVNADSLATWFLEPLARLCAQHPVVFDLHRDDQDFTAGLLEEGTADGGGDVASAPVADAGAGAGRVRYEAVAAFALVIALRDVSPPSPSPAHPHRFRPPRDLQSRWPSSRACRSSLPPRHRAGVAGLRDRGDARSRMGSRCRSCKPSRVSQTGRSWPSVDPDRRAAVLAAVELRSVFLDAVARTRSSRRAAGAQTDASQPR
jgi:hypothetical protein